MSLCLSFPERSVSHFQVPAKDIYLYGATCGTEIIISNFGRDSVKQLNLTAHEHFHALQFSGGVVSKDPGSVITFGRSKSMQVDVADEEAGERFSKEEVAVFLIYAEKGGSFLLNDSRTGGGSKDYGSSALFTSQ